MRSPFSAFHTRSPNPPSFASLLRQIVVKRTEYTLWDHSMRPGQEEDPEAHFR